MTDFMLVLRHSCELRVGIFPLSIPVLALTSSSSSICSTSLVRKGGFSEASSMGTCTTRDGNYMYVAHTLSNLSRTDLFSATFHGI